MLNDSSYTPYSTLGRVNKVYIWMFIGLLVTTLTSGILYASGAFLSLLINAPYVSIVLFLIQIGLTIAMGRSVTKDSSATSMIIMFFIYCFCMGFSLTSLAYAYSMGQIATAFGVSAIYFGCLAVIGKTTKLDLSKVGNICMIGLLAMIVSQIVFLIFRVPMDVRLWSLIGLVIFTGLTAWDMQRLYQELGSNFYGDKIVVYFALQLYLDFINIFLYVLRLIGNKDN